MKINSTNLNVQMLTFKSPPEKRRSVKPLSARNIPAWWTPMPFSKSWTTCLFLDFNTSLWNAKHKLNTDLCLPNKWRIQPSYLNQLKLWMCIIHKELEFSILLGKFNLQMFHTYRYVSRGKFSRINFPNLAVIFILYITLSGDIVQTTDTTQQVYEGETFGDRPVCEIESQDGTNEVKAGITYWGIKQ